MILKFFKRLFTKRNYVYLYWQDKVLNDAGERSLKEEINKYVLDDLPYGKKIEYIDHYMFGMNSYTLLCSFDPKKDKNFLPLIYEIYAFIKLNNDERVFPYEKEHKHFENELMKIELLRFKI